MAWILAWLAKRPLYLVALAVFLAFVLLAHQIGQQRDKIKDLQIEKANAAALADSTRKLTDLVGVLAGQSDAWQQQAEQREVERDSVSKALKLQIKFSGQLMVHLAQMSARLEGIPVTVDQDDVRRIEFQKDTARVHIAGTAAVPAPPATAQVFVTVSVDPLTFGLLIGCGKEIDGVRPAQVTVIAEKGDSVRLRDLRLAPGVCQTLPAPITSSDCSWKALLCPAVSPLLDITNGKFAGAATFRLTRWLRPGVLWTP